MNMNDSTNGADGDAASIADRDEDGRPLKAQETRSILSDARQMPRIPGPQRRIVPYVDVPTLPEVHRRRGDQSPASGQANVPAVSRRQRSAILNGRHSLVLTPCSLHNTLP